MSLRGIVSRACLAAHHPADLPGFGDGPGGGPEHGRFAGLDPLGDHPGQGGGGRRGVGLHERGGGQLVGRAPLAPPVRTAGDRSSGDITEPTPSPAPLGTEDPKTPLLALSPRYSVNESSSESFGIGVVYWCELLGKLIGRSARGLAAGVACTASGVVSDRFEPASSGETTPPTNPLLGGSPSYSDKEKSAPSSGINEMSALEPLG